LSENPHLLAAAWPKVRLHPIDRIEGASSNGRRQGVPQADGDRCFNRSLLLESHHRQSARLRASCTAQDDRRQLLGPDGNATLRAARSPQRDRGLMTAQITFTHFYDESILRLTSKLPHCMRYMILSRLPGFGGLPVFGSWSRWISTRRRVRPHPASSRSLVRSQTSSASPTTSEVSVRCVRPMSVSIARLAVAARCCMASGESARLTSTPIDESARRREERSRAARGRPRGPKGQQRRRRGKRTTGRGLNWRHRLEWLVAQTPHPSLVAPPLCQLRCSDLAH
jgi:hypothetical protein